MELHNEEMNNVAGIWLKGRYIDKMQMYSRPGKIVCILKGTSVQSMNTVSTGVMPLHKVWSSLPLGYAPSYIMTLKPLPPHLFVHPSLINREIMARHHVYFLPIPSPPRQNSLPGYLLAIRPK